MNGTETKTTVKALEWVKHPTADLWRSETIIGVYQVSSIVSPARWTFDGVSSRDGEAATEPLAKDACQADFARQVRSLLEPAALASASAEGTKP